MRWLLQSRTFEVSSPRVSGTFPNPGLLMFGTINFNVWTKNFSIDKIMHTHRTWWCNLYAPFSDKLHLRMGTIWQPDWWFLTIDFVRTFGRIPHKSCNIIICGHCTRNRILASHTALQEPFIAPQFLRAPARLQGEFLVFVFGNAILFTRRCCGANPLACDGIALAVC